VRSDSRGYSIQEQLATFFRRSARIIEAGLEGAVSGVFGGRCRGMKPTHVRARSNEPRTCGLFGLSASRNSRAETASRLTSPSSWIRATTGHWLHRIPLERYLVIKHRLATAMQEMNLSQLRGLQI